MRGWGELVSVDAKNPTIARAIPAKEDEERYSKQDQMAVCTENLIRVDGVMESPKLAE
ncbi:hypothetical protein [Bradyrhizobium erythrophlei]|uniref:Uncharacterized protein n=1 Tax=Bradyrhizobium erythrophlei TaxID=1437360 RepID=A0A1M5HIP1_9BRAD|nr:hypothetical protein [Bradyrhizobium erythrophlei]SHG15833.1 hypothetical protein SAMN05443248_0495 [Bradyrhizobium erythrophlei]